MAFWIFKCDTKQYDLSGRLQDANPKVSWEVNQHSQEIGPGDIAFLWETGRNRRIRAVMRINSVPQKIAELDSEQKHSKRPDTAIRLRVLGTLINRNVNLSHVTLRAEPGLKNLSVFRENVVQRATNFEVSDEEGAILLRLAGSEEDRFSAEEADDSAPDSSNQGTAGGIDPRVLVQQQIRRRRGQRKFRDALRTRYGNQCLVTGCEALAVLEAAHISTQPGVDDNRPENGLLLRSDIHTLFDLDLLGIEPQQMRVELHPTIAKEYAQ